MPNNNLTPNEVRQAYELYKEYQKHFFDVAMQSLGVAEDLGMSQLDKPTPEDKAYDKGYKNAIGDVAKQLKEDFECEG